MKSFHIAYEVIFDLQPMKLYLNLYKKMIFVQSLMCFKKNNLILMNSIFKGNLIGEKGQRIPESWKSVQR